MGVRQQRTSASRQAITDRRKKAVTMSQNPLDRSMFSATARLRLKIDLIGDCDFLRKRATVASDGGALSGDKAWI
jgi:hypothetical protein